MADCAPRGYSCLTMGINRRSATKSMPDIPLPSTSRYWAHMGPRSAGWHGSTGNVPHECCHLSRYGGLHHSGLLSALVEFAISCCQARLSFPRNILNLWRLFLEDVKFCLARSRLQTVGPGLFDQFVAHAGVAYPGDTAAPCRFACRVFAQYKSQLGHQLHRGFETTYIAYLGHGRAGAAHSYASQCLKRNLMREMIKCQTLQPSAIPHRPRLGPLRYQPVAQHERGNGLAFVPLVLCRTFTGADKIAHCLVRFVRHPAGEPDVWHPVDPS